MTSLRMSMASEDCRRRALDQCGLSAERRQRLLQPSNLCFSALFALAVGRWFGRASAVYGARVFQHRVQLCLCASAVRLELAELLVQGGSLFGLVLRGLLLHRCGDLVRLAHLLVVCLCSILPHGLLRKVLPKVGLDDLQHTDDSGTSSGLLDVVDGLSRLLKQCVGLSLFGVAVVLSEHLQRQAYALKSLLQIRLRLHERCVLTLTSLVHDQLRSPDLSELGLQVADLLLQGGRQSLLLVDLRLEAGRRRSEVFNPLLCLRSFLVAVGLVAGLRRGLLLQAREHGRDQFPNLSEGVSAVAHQRLPHHARNAVCELRQSGGLLLLSEAAHQMNHLEVRQVRAGCQDEARVQRQSASASRLA
mmetsp:Transcript_55824/g.120663  ORF Transcript_55824/g.120663 Transcript_55824/m.120663 type:complete len:361 (+) Transcript_55824:88-1170(+)